MKVDWWRVVRVCANVFERGGIGVIWDSGNVCRWVSGGDVGYGVAVNWDEPRRGRWAWGPQRVSFRGRACIALTNVDGCGRWERLCASLPSRAGSARGLFSVCSQREVGKQTRKERLKWDLRIRGVPKLTLFLLLLHLPYSLSNRCGKPPGAGVLAPRHRLWRRS